MMRFLRRKKPKPEIKKPKPEISELLLGLASEIVDPQFYRYRYHDIRDSNMDPVHHFAVYGWCEGRDPNPFTHLQFVKQRHPEKFQSLTTLVEYINEPILHNALLKRPVQLSEIYQAMEQGADALSEIFNLDVEKYLMAQDDVKKSWKPHEFEHLFYDGLFQNRLRNGGHLHRLLVPVDNFVNDYELLTAQTEIFSATSFDQLDLSVNNPKQKANLTNYKIGVGVVLFENDQIEIERLVRSVVSNLEGKPFDGKLYIWDNSPQLLKLDWVKQICKDLTLEIFQHPENPGFAVGHNGMMAEAFEVGCTHYLGVNPDGYLLEEAVEGALRFALGKHQPTLVELESEPIGHPKWYHPLTGETEWVSGACFMIDSAAYELTGGFDPNFPMYCEDTDLSFRASSAGVGLFVALKANYYHDISERLYSPESWRSNRMLIGTWYLCEKWANLSRAEFLRQEILRQGISDADMPERPEAIKNISSEIRGLMTKDRFARSRFWTN